MTQPTITTVTFTQAQVDLISEREAAIADHQAHLTTIYTLAIKEAGGDLKRRWQRTPTGLTIEVDLGVVKNPEVMPKRTPVGAKK